MRIRLTVVDSFTAVPFRGNPAAVTVLGSFFGDELLLAIAREMNLSETAFLVKRPDDDYNLRWFTPSVEVDLCGHATLAAAHLLGDARFHTRSGPLSCSTRDGWIEMDLPADKPISATTPPRPLGARVVSFHRGRSDALVEIESAEVVRLLEPDFGELAALGTRAVIFTAPGDRPGIDFVSRVFAPNAGVPEDPVTGSAHTTLACFWSPRLGRTELLAEQASARGGTVRMRVAGDRVIVAGQAVTVSEVEMAIPDY